MKSKKIIKAKLEEIAKQKIKEPDFRKYPVEQAMELLPCVYQAILGKNNKELYTQINSVSRSGMSRKVSAFIVHKGKVSNLNKTLFAWVYGDRNKDFEVRINGAGFCVRFEIAYRLFMFLDGESFTEKQVSYSYL